MKILGIGIDLVQNSRIRTYIHRNYSERFLRKVLHDHELLYFANFSIERQKVEYLASRWAVKEALNKAIGRKELHFNEILITKD